MKYDELKPLKNLEVAFNTTTEQEQIIAEDIEGNCYGFDSWEEVYLKDEVDVAIAELNAENRRLKRALWLSRALRARDKAFEYHFKNNVEMCAKWDNVHLMLMAKAEGYK